ncbi:hypothetical protein D7X74_03120 [Corallococcus sp. CA047B]|uniref:transposase n=1 Tax=Corallococcus sp. CA047B TaxID=2316729 RepID=UPI000EA24AF3|nr:hypothetical protein D7X74_03120 [Corallococcus sp. CA047B]
MSAGEVEPFEPGAVVHFDPEACGPCKLRPSCTQAASGKGRSVTMGDDERLQQRLRSRPQSRAGRAQQNPLRHTETTSTSHRTFPSKLVHLTHILSLLLLPFHFHLL